MLMAAEAFLASGGEPTDDAIREAIAGNLCRCTGYTKIIDAIRLAAERADGSWRGGPGPGGRTRPRRRAGLMPVEPPVVSPRTLARPTSCWRTRPHRALAGGTDLLVQLTGEIGPMPERVLDLWRLDELRGIAVRGDALELGALTTYTEIRRSRAVSEHAPALVEAAATIGAAQIQNRGTIGGNVMNASPAGDTLPVLLALDAVLVLRQRGGERDGGRGRLLAGVSPDRGATRTSCWCGSGSPLVADREQRFRKVGTRRAQAISKVVVAVCLARARDGTWRDVRIALGSVAATPIRVAGGGGRARGPAARRGVDRGRRRGPRCRDPPDRRRAVHGRVPPRGRPPGRPAAAAGRDRGRRRGIQGGRCRMTELGPNRYGKQSIRLVRVVRGPVHRVRDLTVDVALEGAFEAAFVAGDNSPVVATDTMKNTVYAFATEHLNGAIEAFGSRLASHFLEAEAVEGATITIREHAWEPLETAAGPAPDAFRRTGGMTRTAVVAAGPGGVTVDSGIEDLVVMKTARSAFSGFPRDEYTTLPEVRRADHGHARHRVLAQHRRGGGLGRASRGARPHAPGVVRRPRQRVCPALDLGHRQRDARSGARDQRGDACACRTSTTGSST